MIGLWNYFEDEALDPVIHLDREYASVEFFGGTGRLCGATVKLELTLVPYGCTNLRITYFPIANLKKYY